MLILISSILCFGIGCAIADKSGPLRDGFLLTDPNESSLAVAPLKRADKSHLQEVKAMLEPSIKMTVIEVTNGPLGKVLITRGPVRPNSLKFVGIADAPFNDLKMREFFALHGEGQFGYAALVGGGKIDYERLAEIQLDSDMDCAVSLEYSVNPVDLFQLQRSSDPGIALYLLFHHEIAAPGIVYTHSLFKKSLNASVPVIFQGTSATIKESKATYSRRFVLRRFVEPTKVEALVLSGKTMFEPAPITDLLPLTFGKTNVAPYELRFTVDGKKYRLSSEYKDHLAFEGVRFDVPTEDNFKRQISGAIEKVSVPKLKTPLPIKKPKKK